MLVIATGKTRHKIRQTTGRCEYSALFFDDSQFTLNHSAEAEAKSEVEKTNIKIFTQHRLQRNY